MSYVILSHCGNADELRHEAAQQRRAARRHCTCNSASVEPCSYCDDKAAARDAEEEMIGDACENVRILLERAEKSVAGHDTKAARAALFGMLEYLPESAS